MSMNMYKRARVDLYLNTDPLASIFVSISMWDVSFFLAFFLSLYASVCLLSLFFHFFVLHSLHNKVQKRSGAYCL